MNTPVILETYRDTEIAFQSTDSWVNATQMAKPFNKRVNNFLRADRTVEYIATLEESVARKSVTVIQGGSASQQGTWMHPDLAMEFARWLSPEFSIWCNRVIRRILSGQTAAPMDGHDKLAAAMALLATTIAQQSETIRRHTLGQHRLELRADLTDQRLSALEGENILKMRDAMRPYQPPVLSEDQALAEALRLTLGFEALKEVQAAAIVATIQRYELPVWLSEKQPANSLAKRLIKLCPEQRSVDGLSFSVAHKGRNRHRRYILRRGAVGRADRGSPTY